MGIVFDIQRCCYHDGPGIRTTVFLKGCQLRCAWCHNPESFRRAPQLQLTRRLCTLCGACEGVCPNGVHAIQNGAHTVVFSRCSACGACAEACPAGALTIIGREMTAREVMDTVLRDRVFYEASGGGMTVSGGEPSYQPEFLEELLTLAKEAGISACVETNGYIPPAVLQRLLPLVDLWLIDYKITDPAALKGFTGASGDLWEHTLSTLDCSGGTAVLRMPVIPGINDSPAHFEAAAHVLKQHPCLQKAEIMAYHTIGADKWGNLGYDYALVGLPSATPEQKQQWETLLQNALAAQRQ